MGSLAARDMAAHTDLRTAIGWHLQFNHYPPVPACMVGPAVRAVRRIRAGTEHEARIRLPKGVRHRDGRSLVSAHDLAESFHLYDFT